MAIPQQGQYFAQVTNVETLESKDKGTPFVAIEIEATHIAYNGDWVELPENINRTIRLYLSDGAYEFTEKKLKFLGFNGNYSAPVLANVADGITVNCTIGNYKGKERDEWDLAEWGGGYERITPEANVLAQLQARWNQNESSAAKPVAAPAPPQAATAPAPVRPTQAGPASPPPSAPVPAGGPDDDEPPF